MLIYAFDIFPQEVALWFHFVMRNNSYDALQAKVEQMRAQAQAKMVKMIAMAKQRSEEQKAKAEARRNRQAEKVAAQAKSIRQTGRLPSASFICCGW